MEETMNHRCPTATEIAQFHAHLIAEEKSAATIEKYLRDASAFALWLKSETITKESVLAYKKHLLQSYAPRSVNSMLAALNSFLAFLGCFDCRVKAVKLQQQVFRPEEKELTQAEYFRLCKAAEQKRDTRLTLILQTICATGIRISELRYITVEAALRGEAIVSCKGKTRSVFLVKRLRKKLLRWATEQKITHGMLFVTRSGTPLSRTTVWRAMKALCNEAKVNPKKVFPHNLRHLFAQIFYAMQKDIAKLADLLGHSSINTTRIYILSAKGEHRRCLERMHLIL